MGSESKARSCCRIDGRDEEDRIKITDSSFKQMEWNHSIKWGSLREEQVWEYNEFSYGGS